MAKSEEKKKKGILKNNTHLMVFLVCGVFLSLGGQWKAHKKRKPQPLSHVCTNECGVS